MATGTITVIQIQIHKQRSTNANILLKVRTDLKFLRDLKDQNLAVDPEHFRNSQSMRKLTGQRNPERSKARRKKRVVVLGDSQIKYIKGENLTTSETQVTVKSVSGRRAEQVTSRFVKFCTSKAVRP